MFPLSNAAIRCDISFHAELPDDHSFLNLLYRSTRENELSQTDWKESEKQTFTEMQYKAQQSHYKQHYPEAQWLIIEQNKAPIGRLYIEYWSSEIRIIDIALLPKFCNQGIGSDILRYIQHQGARKNKAVGIHVEKQNPAMSLYKKLGFMVCEDKGVYDLLKWTPN